MAANFQETRFQVDKQPAPVTLGPGYRLSVNVLDEHRVRVAIYDAEAHLVAEYEGFGSSDREGTNVQLDARRRAASRSQ